MKWSKSSQLSIWNQIFLRYLCLKITTTINRLLKSCQLIFCNLTDWLIDESLQIYFEDNDDLFYCIQFWNVYLKSILFVSVFYHLLSFFTSFYCKSVLLHFHNSYLLCCCTVYIRTVLLSVCQNLTLLNCTNLYEQCYINKVWLIHLINLKYWTVGFPTCTLMHKQVNKKEPDLYWFFIVTDK